MKMNEKTGEKNVQDPKFPKKYKYTGLNMRGTKCHKIGLAKTEGGTHDGDEDLIQLCSGTNDHFWGGRTVGPLFGKNNSRTKIFRDLVSIGQNVRVALILGPNIGGLKIRASPLTI